MEEVLKSLIVTQILVVNLVTTHLCLKQKYSKTRSAIILLFVTALVYGGGLFLRLGGHSRVILTIIGFIYYFPIRYLYAAKASKILAIMFFSLTHTLIVNSFAAQVSKISASSNPYGVILAVQSIVFSVTTYFVVRFIRRRFTIVLKNTSAETNKSLAFLGVVLFFTVTTVRFFMESTPFWGLIMVSLLATIAIMCYQLMYVTVEKSKSIEFLRQIAYYDSLTGVNNRLMLFLDADDLIVKDEPFYLVYMDLDNFKQINDTYGHQTGDDYLKSFTKATIEAIEDKGDFYRISGDEFICLYHGSSIDSFLATLEEKIIRSFEMNTPFLGVSIGYAKYPDHGETVDYLLREADTIMYQVKNNKARERFVGISNNLR